MAGKHTSMKVLVVAAFVLLAAPGLLAQVNETPKGHQYYVFAPYLFQYYCGETVFISHVWSPDGQHYEQGIMLLDNRESRADPLCRLDIPGDENDFLDVITAGTDAGAILLTGHGGETEGASYGVEIYDNTEDGHDDADDAVTAYQDQFKYNHTYIYVSQDSKDDYWGVWVTKKFVAAQADLANSKAVVYHAVCHGDAWLSTWTAEGARVAVGPQGSVTLGANAQGVELFSQCLDGMYGIERRPCSAAAAYASSQTGGLTLDTEGNGDTVLAPAVVDWFPTERACPGIDGYVEFDCTMDTDSERTEGMVDGSGCVDVGELAWENNHKVTFDLTAGTGSSVTISVLASKAISANNDDIQLDGNTIPDGEPNAYGPNEDDFEWTVDCDCGHCNGGDPYTIHYHCGACECSFEISRTGCDWYDAEPVATPCPSCADEGTPFCYHQADVWYDEGYWYARVWTNASFRCTVTFDCTFRMEDTICCPAGTYTYYSGGGCCPGGSLYIE